MVKTLLHPENNEVVSWMLLTIVWTSGDSGFPAKTLATLNVLSSIVFGAIPGLFLINYRFVRRTQHINGENIVAS